MGVANSGNPGQHFHIDLDRSHLRGSAALRASAANKRGWQDSCRQQGATMTTFDHLFCLTKYRPSSTAPISAEHAERTYSGQLVFAGPDAAIEIRGDVIRGFVNGDPSHPKGQLAEMIDDYRDSIIETAASLRAKGSETIIISGRWHHIDANEAPRFEAYLTHLVSENGEISTQRYQEEIFDWDDPGLNNGGGFGVYLDGSTSSDIEKLDSCARDKLGKDARDTAVDDLPAVDAILWYPDEGQDLPLILSSVRDVAPGDGTILSALNDRARELAGSPGAFRGLSVDRRSHRPPELKFSELFSATDALGYWLQTKYGKGEPDSMFVFSREPRRWEAVVLKRLEDDNDKNSLRCFYASEWELERGMTATRSRILAVGSIPNLSMSPL